MPKQPFSRVLTIATTVLLALSIFSLPAIAQDTDQVKTTPKVLDRIDQRIDDVNTRREDKIETRCEKVHTRIDKLKDKYQNNKERHINRYDSITDKFSTIINRIKEAGYDVSSIEANVVVLQEKIDNFHVLHNEFLTIMEEAKELDCGEANGEYKAKLQEAKAKLGEVRTQVQEIKSLIRDTMIPDLRAIIAEIKSSN